jgi:signal transduction histidine kinase/CheY-like chemotaxis protein
MKWDEDAVNRELVDRSDDAVVITDQHGKVLRMNAAAHLLGPELEPGLWDGPSPKEVELRDVRGAQRRVIVRTTRCDDVRVHVLRDVTEQRLLEREVRELRRLESLGILAASVVHDLNNLLTAIVCSSALLERERAHSGGDGTLASEILKASEQAVGLIRRMLAFVRRIPGARAAIDVAEVMDSMQWILRRVAGDAVNIRIATEPDSGWAVADREQFEQVLINLAANARDAMPAGGDLVLSTRKIVLGDDEANSLECPSSGSYVVVTATDTGVGMTSAVRERIFDRFFTTKGEGLGTGLGLAAARRFAVESGGCIAVRSAPGEGTSLVLYLPRMSPRVAADAVPRDLDTPLPRGSETVLVAEDEDHTRRAVRGVLERLGYDVVVASSAEQALDVAAAHTKPIDLLLADVCMPDMSGPELAERLRLERESMQVLFMSGHPPDVVARRRAGGGVPFLRKAFSPADLARRVRQVLDEGSPKGDEE